MKYRVSHKTADCLLYFRTPTSILVQVGYSANARYKIRDRKRIQTRFK